MFTIKLGIPEMQNLWNDLSSQVKNGSIGKDVEKLYKKMGKAMALFANDPKDPIIPVSEFVNTRIGNNYSDVIKDFFVLNVT